MMDRRIKNSALAFLGTASTVVLAGLVSKYGVTGTLRLIWEGDHRAPHVRDTSDDLDDLEAELVRLATEADDVDVDVRTAFLNEVDSNDGDEASETRTLSALSPASLSGLKRRVATLDHELDRVTADVDSVRAHDVEELRRRKKRLSTLVVAQMRRVDQFVKLCVDGGGNSGSS